MDVAWASSGKDDLAWAKCIAEEFLGRERDWGTLDSCILFHCDLHFGVTLRSIVRTTVWGYYGRPSIFGTGPGLLPMIGNAL
nr:hypothetical protein CFP56_69565 [Quercus suber]